MSQKSKQSDSTKRTFFTSHTILSGIFNSHHHLFYLHRSFCSPAPSLKWLQSIVFILLLLLQSFCPCISMLMCLLKLLTWDCSVSWSILLCMKYANVNRVFPHLLWIKHERPCCHLYLAQQQGTFNTVSLKMFYSALSSLTSLLWVIMSSKLSIRLMQKSCL